MQQVPDLLLDKREIHQLIFTLVRNGLDAMSVGGTLTIRTFMKKQAVVLSGLTSIRLPKDSARSHHKRIKLGGMNVPPKFALTIKP